MEYKIALEEHNQKNEALKNTVKLYFLMNGVLHEYTIKATNM